MKTIETADIINLYKKCQVNPAGTGVVRNTFNYGTLHNTLNTGEANNNSAQQYYLFKNNTVVK